MNDSGRQIDLNGIVIAGRSREDAVTIADKYIDALMDKKKRKYIKTKRNAGFRIDSFKWLNEEYQITSIDAAVKRIEKKGVSLDEYDDDDDLYRYSEADEIEAAVVERHQKKVESYQAWGDF